MTRRPPQSPPATHVFLEDGGFVERIDRLTVEQARKVIVRLCAELDVERQKKEAKR